MTVLAWCVGVVGVSVLLSLAGGWISLRFVTDEILWSE